MEKRIIFRVPDEMYQQIETVFKKEYPKYRNISQVVRAALKEFLSKEGER